MWNLWQYLTMVMKLAAIWQNLKAVKGSDASTSPVSYQPAADAVLTEPAIQRWLAKRSPGHRSMFEQGLPLFLWGLDSLTE